MTNEHAWEKTVSNLLSRYELVDATSVKQVGGASNTNFRIDTAHGTYLLRLHTGQRLDQQAIKAELHWLERLAAELPIELQRPVSTIHGEIVSEVLAGPVPELLCSLLTWLPGTIPPTSAALNEAQLVQVGSIMGYLHKFAQQTEPPQPFPRPVYDEAYFQSQIDRLVHAVGQTGVATQELARISTGVQGIIEQIAQLPHDRSYFAVIHGDFHSGNYVTERDMVRIIDFDRCGFGFYHHDLALALMELEATQRPLLLQGYQKIRPLPPGHPQLTNLFLCLAFVDNLATLAQNAAELPFIIEELPLVIDALQQAASV
jgi:Ser/Thr protein kinase RdoA (MazF antagonist)